MPLMRTWGISTWGQVFYCVKPLIYYVELCLCFHWSYCKVTISCKFHKCVSVTVLSRQGGSRKNSESFIHLWRIFDIYKSQWITLSILNRKQNQVWIIYKKYMFMHAYLTIFIILFLQLQNLTSAFTVNSELIDWRRFLLAAAQPWPVPSLTQLLKTLSIFKSVDVVGSGLVTQECYMQVIILFSLNIHLLISWYWIMYCIVFQTLSI